MCVVKLQNRIGLVLKLSMFCRWNVFWQLPPHTAVSSDWFYAVSLRLSLHYIITVVLSVWCLRSCAAAAMHVLTLALCEIFGQYLALL